MISYWADTGRSNSDGSKEEVLMHKIEENDYPEIKKQIFEMLKKKLYNYEDYVTVSLKGNSVYDTVNFTVLISNFISERDFYCVQNSN